ncbi:spindle pole body component 98-like [Physella acuta]|uniref:spindle pole body component 98-like n=1 Tax=Physella acuta TaxID=109671 RepID=UPI0027DCBA3F|nr:spindle pole body component 98-like [Physella acuta]
MPRYHTYYNYDDDDDDNESEESYDDGDESDDESYDDDTLNLHGCSVDDAITKLREFLTEKKRDYVNSGRRRVHRFVDVITGRGVHSDRGYSIVKQKVKKYLRNRRYSMEWHDNGGCVTIDFYNSGV